MSTSSVALRSGRETSVQSGKTVRVCIYQRFLPPDPSGAGKQALTLGRVLREMGCEVVFLTDASLTESRAETLDDFQVARIAPPPATESYPQLLAYWKRIAASLLELRGAFDVLHIHAADFHHAAAAPLGRLLGKPVLVRSSIGGEFTNLSGSWSGRLQRQMYRAADAFVVLSERIAAEYIRAGLPPDRLNQVVNGVDTSIYRPVTLRQKIKLREELNLPAHGTLLVYHGVFIERKSLHWIIESLEDLLSELDLHLILVGGATREQESRSYAASIQDQAKSSNAAERIIIRGADPEVHRYLQASDAYVLASTNEGLSNALLEAMAVGLVPIVSQASGSEDVVQHGMNGLLFPPRDAAAFRATISTAFGSVPPYDLRAMSAHATERIRADYSIKVTAQNYLDIYRRVLSQGGRGSRPDR